MNDSIISKKIKALAGNGFSFPDNSELSSWSGYTMRDYVLTSVLKKYETNVAYYVTDRNTDQIEVTMDKAIDFVAVQENNVALIDVELDLHQDIANHVTYIHNQFKEIGIDLSGEYVDNLRIINELFDRAYKIYDSSDRTTQSVFMANKEQTIIVHVVNNVIDKRVKFSTQTTMDVLLNNHYTPIHLLTYASVPLFNKRLFNQLTDVEKTLFRLFSNVAQLDIPVIKETLRMFVQQEGMDELIRTAKQKSILKIITTNTISSMKSSIASLETRIEEQLRQMNRTQAQIVATQKELLFNEINLESNTKELVSYLAGHPYILDMECSTFNSDTLNFCVKVPLTQWDTDVAKIVLSNFDKQNGIRGNYTTEEIQTKIPMLKTILEHILLIQDVTYNSLGMYSIQLNTEGTWQYSYENHFDTGHINMFGGIDGIQQMLNNNAGLNPHINYYACTGTYRAQITTALSKKDLITTLECLNAPLKNWNLTDGAVNEKMFGTFFRCLLNAPAYKELRCFEYKGTPYSLYELYDVLTKSTETTETKPKRKRTIKKKDIEPTADPLAEVELEGDDHDGDN